LVMKLRGAGGGCVWGKLAEFGDQHLAPTAPSTAVSTEKRSRIANHAKRNFKDDDVVDLQRAHARCGHCHAACRAIRAIGGRPGLAVAPCAAWGDRFAAVSRDDCGRPKLEFSQRLSFRKAPPGDPIGKPALQAHGQDVGDGERCQFYPQEMPRRHLTKLHYSVDFQRKQQEQKPNNKHLH